MAIVLPVRAARIPIKDRDIETSVAEVRNRLNDIIDSYAREIVALLERVVVLEAELGYSTVEDEGVPLIQRTTMNFAGAGVTATDSAGKTLVTIPGGGGGGYATVEDEGVPLTQRTTMNFVGAGVTASDSGAKTTVSIPGGAGSTTGTATLNFGAFPGAMFSSVAVTGQAGIVSGSVVEAWLRRIDTADHNADEVEFDPPVIYAGTIVAGTGFTIYGVARDPLAPPYPSGRQQIFDSFSQAPRAPMIWGQWSVQWRWT